MLCRPSSNGVITFGCLNNFCKINDGVLALWAQVLQAVPRSRLLLRAPRGRARDNVLASSSRKGSPRPAWSSSTGSHAGVS